MSEPSESSWRREVRRRLQLLETATRLGISAIRDGYLEVRDRWDRPVARLGILPEGGVGLALYSAVTGTRTLLIDGSRGGSITAFDDAGRVRLVLGQPYLPADEAFGLRLSAPDAAGAEKGHLWIATSAEDGRHDYWPALSVGQLSPGPPIYFYPARPLTVDGDARIDPEETGNWQPVWRTSFVLFGPTRVRWGIPSWAGPNARFRMVMTSPSSKTGPEVYPVNGLTLFDLSPAKPGDLVHVEIDMISTAGTIAIAAPPEASLY